jgi:hypothetical protein
MPINEPLALMDGYFCIRRETKECKKEFCEGCNLLYQTECQEIVLIYFGSSRKYHTEATLKIPKAWDSHRVFEFVYLLQQKKALPGLVEGTTILYVVISSGYKNELRLIVDPLCRPTQEKDTNA